MADLKNRITENETAISQALAKKNITIPVYYHSTTDSTMNLAKEHLAASPADFAVYISDMQTDGRGRQSRKWESLAGNLFATYAMAVPGDTSKLSGFSLVAGLAMCKTLADMGVRVRLKWPNDLLTLSTKKIGGILVEISEIGGKKYLLCGIGLNLVDKPAGIENVSSVKDTSGQVFSPSQVLVKFTPHLKSYFERFIEKGFATYKNEWMQQAAFIGRDITVHVSKDKKVSGMLMGVSTEGSLQIEIGGKIETVNSGDITIHDVQE